MRTQALATLALALAACPDWDRREPTVSGPTPFPGCSDGTSSNVYRAAEVEPHVAVNPRNSQHLVAMWMQDKFDTPAALGVVTAASFDGGRSWTRGLPPVTDCVTGAHRVGRQRAADPWVTFGGLYAAWSRIVEVGDAPISFTRSTDAGRTWEEARPVLRALHTEYYGVQILVLRDGALALLATAYDRLTAGVTLEVVRSTDGGKTWSEPVPAAGLHLVQAGDRWGDGWLVRSGLGFASAAVAPDGTVWAAWEDSGPTDGSWSGIAVIRSKDGGLTWSEPVFANGAPSAPAFTPALAILGDGTVGVVYYDLRSDGAGGGLMADAWIAQSSDGITWSDEHVAGPFDLAGAPHARGLFLGDYQGLVASGDLFVSIQARPTGVASNPTDVFAARLGRVP